MTRPFAKLQWSREFPNKFTSECFQCKRVLQVGEPVSILHRCMNSHLDGHDTWDVYCPYCRKHFKKSRFYTEETNKKLAEYTAKCAAYKEKLKRNPKTGELLPAFRRGARIKRYQLTLQNCTLIKYSEKWAYLGLYDKNGKVLKKRRTEIPPTCVISRWHAVECYLSPVAYARFLKLPEDKHGFRHASPEQLGLTLKKRADQKKYDAIMKERRRKIQERRRQIEALREVNINKRMLVRQLERGVLEEIGDSQDIEKIQAPKKLTLPDPDEKEII